MSGEIAKLRILVETDATGVDKGFAVATAAGTGWASAMQKAFASVSQAGSQLSGMWGSLSTGQKTLAGFGVGAALVGTALKATIVPAIEFESAFAGVKKTVDGSPQVLEGLRQGLLNLSKVMPSTANELAVIAENAGQLGVKAPDILKFTEVVAQLAETTDLDFDSAATQMARFLNITGGGPALIDKASNALVGLGNAGASTESEILDFSQRLASAVTVAGGSEDQILALASAFSSFGIRAEAGGSALSTIITNISDSARGGNGNLKIFAETAGILPDQFARIARENPVEALILFGEGLGKIVEAGGSVTPVMESVQLGGLRTSEVMRLLALNSGQVREALKLAADEFANGTARQDEYDRRQETTASRLEILRNRIMAIQIAVGTNFLSAFATGADMAGDAITELAEILTPLAGEIEELFGNGAKLAGQFWSTVGGPAAKLAVLALIGAADALTALLSVVNGLGPAGLGVIALMATLAGFGPGVRPLVFVIDSLAASIYRIATAGSAGSAAMMGFNAALSTGPLLIGAAALVAYGYALTTARREAEAAGAAIREKLNKSVEEQDWDGFNNRMNQTRAELRNLNNDLGNGELSWKTFGLALKGTAELLPGIDNSVLNSIARQRELKAVLDDPEFGQTFQLNVGAMADRLGIHEKEVIAALQATGQLDLANQTSAAAWQQLEAVVQGYTNRMIVLGEVFGVTREEMTDSIDSIDKLSMSTQVSGDNLQWVASRIKEAGFEMKAMFDEDPDVRMAALARVAEELAFVYGPLADQVGVTTDKFISQNRAIGDMAAGYDELEAAIRGVVDTLNSLNEPTERFNEAMTDFDEKIKTAGKGFDEFQAAAFAGREAIAAYAGTAPEFDDLIGKQKELAAQLYESALQFTGSKELAAQYVAELFGIPESVLSLILLEAEKAKADAEAVKADLNDVDGAVYQAILDADPELAMQVFNEMRLAKTDYEGAVSTTLGVDNAAANAAIQQSVDAAFLFAGGTYEAPLTADPGPAIQGAETARASANAFVGARYQATYTADNSNAVNQANVAAATGQQFAARKYLAHYEANNNDALTKASQATGEAVKFGSQRPKAILTADSSQAVGSIQAALNRLNQFQSKSITITSTTINRSVGIAGTASLAGSIYNSAGVKTFASGGFYGGGADFLAPVRQQGPAFYPAVPNWARVFAEPATGGEWFLPARGDRARQYAIWSHAGRTLGFQGEGGRAVSVAVSAPISIDARGATDPAAIGAEVERRMTALMDRTSRGLLNLRRS